MKNRDSKRVPDDGGEQWLCRNCGQPMQRWKHADDWTPPKDKGWFLFWFECMTKTCRTKQVMPKEGFVRAGGDPPTSPTSRSDGVEQTLGAEDIQRLAHFRSI